MLDQMMTENMIIQKKGLFIIKDMERLQAGINT